VLGDHDVGFSLGFGDSNDGGGGGANGISTAAFDVYDMLLHRSIQTS